MKDGLSTKPDAMNAERVVDRVDRLAGRRFWCRGFLFFVDHVSDDQIYLRRWIWPDVNEPVSPALSQERFRSAARCPHDAVPMSEIVFV